MYDYSNSSILALERKNKGQPGIMISFQPAECWGLKKPIQIRQDFDYKSEKEKRKINVTIIRIKCQEKCHRLALASVASLFSYIRSSNCKLSRVHCPALKI